MDRQHKLRPIAAALANLGAKRFPLRIQEQDTKASDREIPRFQRAGAWLPLGAMLSGMVLAPLQGSAADAAAGARPQEEATLPSVHVEGTLERETRDYRGGMTSIGKIPQEQRDIPQALTVVTKQLYGDRKADTLREALRVVPSLTFNAGEGGRIGDNITIRGYSAVSDLYLDGMRDIAQYNREVFNLERIEVLRGSASMLFGRGSTGGVINQVSKVPLLEDRNRLAFTVGSNDYKRVTADLNKPLGETTAIRVNAMGTDTESFRNGVAQQRRGLAPSIAWGIGTQDEFTLAYYRLEDNNVPDYGVPYFQGKPLQVPVERFYGVANADYERNETGIATATYIHRFDADTSLKTALRNADYSRDLWAVAPRLAGTPTAITDSTVINRQAQRRAGDEHTLTSQTDFTTKVDTGPIKHQLLTGVELVREEAERWNWVGGGANPTTTVGNPNPYPTLPANFFNAAKGGQVNYDANTVGLYAQDLMDLTERWKLLLGARWDRFDADYDRAPPAGALTRSDRVWSYRTGLIYQPSIISSYYVAYGTSFNPSAELYSLDDRGANTPPEKSRNIEVGAKWDLFEGDLSLRTALFRSEKTNERNTDLSVSVAENLLSGKRRTDGIEIEAAGRISSKWEVFGALALMDGKITAATGQQANTLGKVPINTPDYTANLWSTYKLFANWKVGGGLEAVGKRYGNNTDTSEAPKYLRWDALVAYEQRSYEVRFNVFNLFSEDYYEGVYQGHVVPGTKRVLYLTTEFKF